MAAPITHILLALQILQSGLLPMHDEAQFIRGTSFPDIRHFVGLKREITHLQNITWSDVENEKNSFIAGFYFHSFVDEFRIELLENTPFYNNLQGDNLNICFAIKLAEDRLFADACTELNWDHISAYFDTIDQEALNFGVSEEQLYIWYSYIKEHWSSKMNDTYINKIVCMSANKEKNKEVQNILLFLKCNEAFKTGVLAFYNNFIDLIKLHKNVSLIQMHLG